MILYLLPVKEDYSEQPFFYIEQMLENVKKQGAELPGFQFNAKQFKCVNKNFKSKIIFISAQGSSKGKSFSANLVIIDEAAYIDDANVYEQVSNSTSDTKGRMRSISTINVDTPINWFFFKKVSLDGAEDCRVVNIDIRNNPFLTDAEKRRKELQYK
jgi:phage terminase large subunit-like protein